MKQNFKDHQKILLKTNKKLTCYTIFKTENKNTEFLHYVKNLRHEKVINWFRLGNHLTIRPRGRMDYESIVNSHGLFKLVVHKAEKSNCFSINLLIGQKGCIN